jgi:rRNA pseudouridine-1189 N-methylase Emg1 (Nep1/Mra1 family)
MKIKSRAICFALLLTSFDSLVNAQERKMKIYISADMSAPGHAPS